MSRHSRLNSRERRARLALKTGLSAQLEPRTTITEPISLTALSLGMLPAFIRSAVSTSGGSVAHDAPLSYRPLAGTSLANSDIRSQARGIGPRFWPIATAMKNGQASGSASASVDPSAIPRAAGVRAVTAEPDLIGSLGTGSTAAGTSSGISLPWKPVDRPGGGGALPPRGGSAALSGAMTAASGRHPTAAPSQNNGATAPGASSSAAAAGALLSTLGLSGVQAASQTAIAPGAGAAASQTTISRNALAASLNGGQGTSIPGKGLKPMTSPAFELETLDYNDGSVMTPGFDQLATPGGSVDLRAQVRDSATGTYTYTWTTSGLTDANSISGASTYDLTFQWNTTISTANAESTTLTVTDPNLNQVSQTYTFWLPAGTGSATGGTTWNNQTLDPGLLSAAAPAFSSQDVSVVADTGALQTSIALPTYNPNVAPIVLNYNSLAANALPIVVAEHQLDPTKSTPSQVSAQLTFNGSAGSTYYYNTSALTPGDIMQIGLQANATSLSTGRYSYTETIIDYRGGTPTTFTYNGTATIENAAQDPTFKALGAGWTISGLNKIISASGGVILDEGDGSVLWFSGSFGGGGGTYTSPAGDFSTLVLNSNGTYTRTLTDGTVQSFNSSGLETASTDRNGLTTTFTYSSSRLTAITDPFNQTTSLTYNGSNQLQSIENPASHFTTFTLSSGDLTAVEYPDTSTWDYGYDSSGRMTSLTEPSSTGEPTKIVTITYDSAERVGTITRADSTAQTFSPAQVQGWTNSGTSGSPAASVLLAEVGSTNSDPLGDTTTLRPDWRGMGLTDQSIDAIGNVSTYDRNSNGLATISIDPLNRITQDAYDSHGNVTETIYPDLSTTVYGTYNSFAEPSTITDQISRVTSFTYDSHGNLTVEEDPLDYVTTYTYSSTQPGMLTNQTAPALVGHSSYNLVTYQYDSYDRQTTVTNADNDVTVKVYSSAGQVTKITDPNTNVTTYSYDSMNRETGETAAAGSSIAGVSTYTYDAAGNQVTSTDPDNDTTTTTYDALDRVSTVKTPDGGVTSYVYDNAGRLHVLTDPVGNATTYTYNALGEQTEVTSPSVNSSSGVSATYVYDADGELVDTTDADGRRTTYSYDLQGDQTGESWLNSSGSSIYTATFTFDADREMTGATDPYATLTMAYDRDGWLGTIATSGPGTGQPTVTLTYGYDSSGDVTGITDSLSGTGAAGQGITSYVYDNALRLGTITQSLGGTAVAEVTLTYDAGGRLEYEDRTVSGSGGSGTSVNTSIAYDAANSVTTMSDSVPPPPPGPGARPLLGSGVFDVNDYTPDAAGRVTSMTYNDANSMNTYAYDSSGQLTGSSGSQNNTYTYDLNGNRNSTGYTTGAGNEMTNSPGVTYTYDNVGNRISATTSSGTTTYTYDYEDRLTSVDQYGTMIATYTYNALGQRIGIKDSGTQTWTVYNGKSAEANPYADFNSSGSVTMRYLDGRAVDELLARTSSSGTTAWYITDKLGSVEDVVSTGGTLLDHIVYDSFGNITTQTDATNGDRFKFAGMEYDSTTGLYYDHARYYDSVTGRFMSQDPTGFAAGDTNPYRYVQNEPTGSVDPSGLIPKKYTWEEIFNAIYPPRPPMVPGPPVPNPPPQKKPPGGPPFRPPIRPPIPEPPPAVPSPFDE